MPLEAPEGGTYRLPEGELGRIVLGRFGTKLRRYLREGYTLTIEMEGGDNGGDKETFEDCVHG